MDRFPNQTFSFSNFNFGRIRDFLKFLTFSRLKQFLRSLEKREKIIFLFLFLLFLGSAVFLGLSFYFGNTGSRPAPGGSYIEGLIGQPRFINPVYAQANDVDRDLTELIFSGLMKYNSKGEIVPDLVEKYEIKENGKVYELGLKEGVLWHDGQPFSADDVIFTVKIIQDPNYNSRLRASFFGVEVEKISDFKVRFMVKNAYAPFLETLTFKILPKHIWQDIPFENFPLSIYNFKPIGTGPFKFKDLEKDDTAGRIKSLSLVRNYDYFEKAPYLSEILFRFFEDENSLLEALRKGEIDGLVHVSPKNLGAIKEKDFNIYQLSFPRYFDIAFNPERSEILAEKEVRKALNYGTNKEVILTNIILGYGETVNSPFIPEIHNIPNPKDYEFDPEKAKEILEEAGWKDENGDGKREKIIKKGAETLFERDLKKGNSGPDVESLQTCLAKDPSVYPEGEITGYFGAKTEAAVIKFQEKYAKDILDPWGFKEGTGLVSRTTRVKLTEICSGKSEEITPLKFSLVTVDQEELSQVADLIKEQWGDIGVEVEIKKVPTLTLEQNFIKSRDYEALLVGKVMGLIPDPYPFWHSSQKRDPGLNLSLYDNKKVDKILEDARQALNEKERRNKYQEFQEILIEDVPVVFLYSPNYLYSVSEEIKGIDGKIMADPSKRFVNIENWYIKTKRAWQ